MNRAKDFATRYAPDPYTVLLMHMDGANNGTVFTEETGKSVTRSLAAYTKTDQSKYGGASLLANTINASLRIAENSDFVFGNGDFTVDFWAYHLSTDRTYYFFVTYRVGVGALAWQILATSNEKVVININIGGTLYKAEANTAFTTNTWTHYAAVRNGAELSLYVNGIKQTTTANIGTSSLDNPAGCRLTIGELTNGNANANSYIDELRISKGIARWTSDFTPPTSPYAR